MITHDDNIIIIGEVSPERRSRRCALRYRAFHFARSSWRLRISFSPSPPSRVPLTIGTESVGGFGESVNCQLSEREKHLSIRFN